MSNVTAEIIESAEIAVSSTDNMIEISSRRYGGGDVEEIVSLESAALSTVIGRSR